MQTYEQKQEMTPASEFRWTNLAEYMISAETKAAVVGSVQMYTGACSLMMQSNDTAMIIQ